MSPETPSARRLAVDILARAAGRDKSVEDLLAGALRRYPKLSRPERAFLLELVQGVKRWEIRLDYALSRLSNLPLKKLHPLVLILLRVAAYQLLFLDRVPARAAVSEAVNLARTHKLPQAHAGFLNAVLRSLAAGVAPPLPDPAADPAMALSIQTAHPEWLVRRWLRRYGLEETQARLDANNRIPPLTLRVNRLKTDPVALTAHLAQEGVQAAALAFSPTGLRLTAWEAAPQELPSYRQGLWLFQDEAAQLASLLLPLTPGQRLLELGAGRGGKTTHLAELMQNQGLIAAVDNHRARIKALTQTLKRWGVTIARPVLADATRPLPFQEKSFDAVLIDAPCSALGIIRRHPEIKTRLTEADLATFPPRQRSMLEAAAPLLKPGGYLLYITCTTEPEENEDLIQAFLGSHPEFRLHFHPDRLPPPARPLLTPPGWFRTSPAAHGLDAFFAAVMVRE